MIRRLLRLASLPIQLAVAGAASACYWPRLMNPPDFDIHYVANLARIRLSNEEASLYRPQLAVILDYMRRIDEVEVEGMEPMAHANPVLNVMRQDLPGESLSQEAVLANGPATALGQFVVPKVVE